MIALLYLGLLVVAFFLLIVRPQRRQLAAHRALVASLEVGDEIITSGGVYGTIRSMDDAVLQVEIADGLVVRVARGAVASKASAPAHEPSGHADPADEIAGDNGAPHADGASRSDLTD